MEISVVGMPVLEILLMAIMFLAVFVEIKTGGFGAGILLGLVAAGVFWGSQYMQGLVDLYPIAMFLGGVLCIVFELLMPTIGLLAALGIAAMFYSLVLALGGDLGAVYAMVIAFAVAVIVFALIINHLPSSHLWNKLVLHDESTSSRGYVSSAPQDEWLGKEGEAMTELRPAGTALIEGKPIDVVTEGVFMEKGEKVRVINVQGSRIVVRKI